MYFVSFLLQILGHKVWLWRSQGFQKLSCGEICRNVVLTCSGMPFLAMSEFGEIISLFLVIFASFCMPTSIRRASWNLGKMVGRSCWSPGIVWMVSGLYSGHSQSVLEAP